MLLITGAHGFLGKHIQKLLPHAICPTREQVDLMNGSMLATYVKSIRVDKILHLAALCGGIKYNRLNPAKLIHDNVQMALNVFEAAKMCKVKEVITIGSTCQYPLSADTPFKTKDMWNGYPEPTNGPYGIAKRTIYELGQAYSYECDINHKHLILANIYGPGDTSDHVIPELIYKAMSNDVIEAYGDGNAVREFLYVSDAAEIISKLIDIKFSGAVNIGTNHTTTIRDLLLNIQRILRTNKKASYNMYHCGQGHRLLDSQYLGTTELNDGLKKTIKWMRATHP